ncbi:hypothetical protein ACX0G7_26095 [Flavitalea antarctica]
MRKEKLSYVILLAEIAAIIWLHSVKLTENKQVSSGTIVNTGPATDSKLPSVRFIQAVHR